MTNLRPLGGPAALFFWLRRSDAFV